MFKKGCIPWNKGKQGIISKPRMHNECYHSKYGAKITISCCKCGLKMERYISQLVNHNHHGGKNDKFYCIKNFC